MDTSDDSTQETKDPGHMSVWARNQRLYDTLNGMGLFVLAVMRDDDPTMIDQIIVSAGIPSVILTTLEPSSNHVAEADILFPVEGFQVTEAVRSTLSQRNNVVPFPPKS